MTRPPTGVDPFEHDDAAYAMGALDADQSVAFEAHLVRCGACRERVRIARATVAMLGPSRDRSAGPVTMPQRPPDSPGGLPDTLLPALVRSVRREQRRRRIVTGSLACLAAACLIALVVAVWPSGQAAPHRTDAPRAMTAVSRAVPIRATARLVDHPWGTGIDVHCRYAKGHDADMPYDLVVLDRAGVAHQAGSWQLGAGGSIDFVGGVQVRRERIDKVQVTLPDGRPVLQLAVR